MTAQEQQDEFHDIRDAVAKLCAQFPGEYWRKLDRQMAYPKEFVDALTEAGYLSVLIPEEYGGSGLKLSAAAAILEEIQRAGCNGGGCHAQMYTMGTLLRHGSDAQKRAFLPKIASGELRLQAFGVTEPTTGSDTRARSVSDGSNQMRSTVVCERSPSAPVTAVASTEAWDYIAHGVRHRASELVTRELGHQSEIELQTKLQNEVEAERLTRLINNVLDFARPIRFEIAPADIFIEGPQCIGTHRGGPSGAREIEGTVHLHHGSKPSPRATKN